MTAVHERHERTLRKYGLNEEQWGIMWDHFGGHCPICRKPFGSTRLPCVDHDHVSGRIRGLLCTACNYWLGEMHDNAAKLRRAADYLDNSEWHWGDWFVPGSPGAPHDG